MSDSPPSTPFQLSRIYAKGWDAGMRCEAQEPAPDAAAEAAMTAILAQGDALNPCTAKVDRDKWMQGFTEAVHRKFDGPQRRKRK
ncbi:MAG TPA: hypothetical protein VGB82_19110 [Alphaproteobacteria bacterium]